MIRIFDLWNEKDICPVCGTNKPGKTALLPIDGTENQSGDLCEGMPVHYDCLDLRVKRENQPYSGTIIYQIGRGKI